MRKFAAFDIDGTLLRWQFFHAIVNELGKNGILTEPEHHAIKQARMQWKNRTTSESFHVYETVLLNTYLAALPRISQETHNQAEDAVYEQYKHQLFTYTRDLIHSLQHKGYYIVAISGSHHYIVSKFCQNIGIDDFIGAKAEIVEGKYTGKMISPVFDKANALKDLIAKHNLDLADSYAIGDSASDAAMLSLVENPIAFNPEMKLFDIAIQNKWLVVVERKNVVYRLEYKHNNYILSN